MDHGVDNHMMLYIIELIGQCYAINQISCVSGGQLGFVLSLCSSPSQTSDVSSTTAGHDVVFLLSGLES